MNYEITIGGVKAKAHTARVSAMPFNRHWPGYQRSLDQTERAPFIFFELDSPVDVCVTANRDFNKAVVRPLPLGIVPTSKGRKIFFTIPGPGQYTLELDGLHGALHIFANPIKQFEVDAGDPYTIYFGPGTYDAGTIELKSGQTLYIDADAVVYGQIRATNVTNIRICGNGILDHSRIEADEIGITRTQTENSELIDPNRPCPVLLYYCQNVEIEGLVIRDPCFVSVRSVACENVTITNTKIIGCWRYNAAGIDFCNSLHCRVRNCFVRTFDDSMCLKGFYFLYQGEMFHNHRVYTVLDDVVFENCVVWNEWGKALEVGVDLCAMEVRNSGYRNCYVIHCGGTAVMDLSNVDYAEVHDILFENIHVEYDDVIQQPTMQVSDNHEYVANLNSTYMPYLFLISIAFTHYSHGGVVRGHIHDIAFRNIQVYASRIPPSLAEGYNDFHEVRSVLFDNISLNGKKIEHLADLNLELGRYVQDVECRS